MDSVSVATEILAIRDDLLWYESILVRYTQDMTKKRKAISQD
jgi:hypothetical protein